jgi:hypothetical protein
VTTLESTSERLEEALRRLAVEAADLFEELLASGAELPFDLEPTQGDGPLPMYAYAPLTGEFIERHAGELRRLEAFLEVRDMTSEEVAIGFLIGLWEGRAEFDVAGDRLAGAIDGVLAATGGGAGDGATPAGEVVVPLIGFHMPADEIELDGVRIVRADSISDAPLDALEATRGSGGKPGFLATVSCGFANVAPAAAVADDLQRALRTMRLFRPGAVGLAAHGWARRAGGWERFGTGAARPRNGGYRLTGNEAADLETFARQLAERGASMPALAWAVSRFDLGAERPSLIEALSDYLLALRGLLEGGGPAGAGLSARVAALACETPSEREAARICIERALTIERKLMSGARYRPTADASPLAVIAGMEDLLRSILKGLARGKLTGDLRAMADEKLLAEGLNASPAPAPSVGETAEWRIPDPTPDHEEEMDLSSISDGWAGEGETGEIAVHKAPHGFAQASKPTRIVVTDVELPVIMGVDENPPPEQHQAPFASEPEEPAKEADWFASADGEVEWPAFASPRRKRGEEPELDREAEDRVRYLFPVPDATDWDVGELKYERKRSG